MSPALSSSPSYHPLLAFANMDPFKPDFPLSKTLPKVVETLRDDPPEYLRWSDSHKSKTAMRQLSVAFQDNIGTAVDWRRIAQLQTVPDALEYCMNHPITIGETPVYILGITHSSDHSAEHVAVAIEKISPATIALESCVDRTQARVSVQLPLVEKFGGDWPTITDSSDFGGNGPSLVDLAKHGLLDGSMDVAQFMVASGSISGCPELTALYEGAVKRSIPIESIDILESVKIVQNASIDAAGYSSRRPGDLSEGVLRQVVGEEEILSEYFRMMYGDEEMLKILPSFMYRLIESRKRSPPFADLLLRELHRAYRPKQYWCRIFLRDIYMSFRLRRLASKYPGRPILAIVGASHVFGIRDMLETNLEMPIHAALSLSCLLDNAENLADTWRDVLRIDSFSTMIPRQIDNIQAAAALIGMSILSARKVSLWLGNEWQVIELPPQNQETSSVDRLEELTRFEVSGGVGKTDLISALIDGKLDPYSIARFESQNQPSND